MKAYNLSLFPSSRKSYSFEKFIPAMAMTERV